MLKTVSSIANAIGALNYKGTWDANANSPALTSSVGTKGDYYVVGTAGATNLNGISNWGIGDWAVFNGAVWQRVEGGANLNGVDLSVSGTSQLTGNATFSNNLVQGTAAKGVNFTANTPAAGMTSQLLNWYEEGTFTPTVQGSSTAGTGTYNARGGVYTRIGNMVTVQVYMNLASHTGTGNIQFGALPFTSATGANIYGSVTIGYLESCTVPANSQALAFISPNTTFVGLYTIPSGGGAMTPVAMDTSFSVMYTATYRVA